MKARERLLSLGMAALVAAGCATVGGKGGGVRSGDTFVDVERNFAFRVPSGWTEEKSSNPFRRSDAVRFQSPEGDAGVIVRTTDVGSATCIDAAKRLVSEADGAEIRSSEPFTIATPEGELPAWRGDLRTTGGRRGRVSLFCTGGRVVVLQAAADEAAYARRADAIDTAIRSFAYAGSPTIVAVAPPPKPTPPDLFEHLVQWRGQTLGRIAQWYTGKYDNWKKLTGVNPDLTVGNAPLRVGRTVRIPRDLVTRTMPMPRPVVRKERPKPPPESPAEQAEAAPEEAAPAEAEAEPEAEPEPPADLPPVIGPK